jgi:hypothetical protein
VDAHGRCVNVNPSSCRQHRQRKQPLSRRKLEAL